jgi:stearoyl-CoA desaturase (delta-9 desaturase)
MPPALYRWLTEGLSHLGWVGIIVYFLVVTQLTIFAVTLYLHRSQAHRAVDFHPVLAHFFRFWSWLTTSMVTKEWAAIHRKHHAKCETEEDQHSPWSCIAKRAPIGLRSRNTARVARTTGSSAISTQNMRPPGRP